MMTRASALAVVLGVAWLLNASIGVAGPADGSAASGIEAMSWMSGKWVSEGGGIRAEEHWTRPAGGTMFGVSRSIKGDRTVFFEYLRVEQTEKGTVYYASPRGRCPATEFTMTAVSDREVVFENPEHDFPQRIAYRLNDDGSLSARIDGTQDGESRSSEWTWKRLEGGNGHQPSDG